jgi:hypothetical protein
MHRVELCSSSNGPVWFVGRRWLVEPSVWRVCLCVVCCVLRPFHLLRDGGHFGDGIGTVEDDDAVGFGRVDQRLHFSRCDGLHSDRRVSRTAHGHATAQAIVGHAYQTALTCAT